MARHTSDAVVILQRAQGNAVRTQKAQASRLAVVVAAEYRKQTKDRNIEPDYCDEQAEGAVPLHVLRSGTGIGRLLDKLEIKIGRAHV